MDLKSSATHKNKSTFIVLSTIMLFITMICFSQPAHALADPDETDAPKDDSKKTGSNNAEEGRLVLPINYGDLDKKTSLEQGTELETTNAAADQETSAQKESTAAVNEKPLAESSAGQKMAEAKPEVAQPRKKYTKVSEAQKRALKNIPYDEKPRLSGILDLMLSALIWVSNIDETKDRPYRSAESERLSTQEQATRLMTFFKGIVEMYDNPEEYKGPRLESTRDAIVKQLEPHRQFGSNPLKGLRGFYNAIQRNDIPKAKTLGENAFSNAELSTAITAFRADAANFTQQTLMDIVSAGTQNSDALLGGVFVSLVDFLKEPAFAGLFRDSIVLYRKYRNENALKEVEAQIQKIEAGETISEKEVQQTISSAESALEKPGNKKSSGMIIEASEFASPAELELLNSDPKNLGKRKKRQLRALKARLNQQTLEINRELAKEKAEKSAPKEQQAQETAPQKKTPQPTQGDLVDQGLGKVIGGFDSYEQLDDWFFKISSNSENIIFFLKALTKQSLQNPKHLRRIYTLIKAFERRLNNQILPSLYEVGNKVSVQLRDTSGPDGGYLEQIVELLFQDYLRKLPSEKKKDILIDIMRGSAGSQSGDSFQRSLAIITDHFGPAIKQLLQMVANGKVNQSLSEVFTSLQQHGKAISWEEVIRNLENSDSHDPVEVERAKAEAKKLKSLLAEDPGYSVNSGKAFRGFRAVTQLEGATELSNEFFRVMRFDFKSDLSMDSAILQQLISKLTHVFPDDRGRPASPERVRRILANQIAELKVEGDLVQTFTHQEMASERLNHKILIERPAGDILIEFYVPKSMPVQPGDKVQRMELLNPLDAYHVAQYEGVRNAESAALYQMMLTEMLRPLSPKKMQKEHEIQDMEKAKATLGFLYTDPHNGNRLISSIEQKTDYLHVRVPLVDFGLALYEKLNKANMQNLISVIVGCTFNDQKLISESIWRMRNPKVPGQTKKKLREGIREFVAMQKQNRVRYYTPEEMITYLDRNEFIEVQPWLFMTQRAFVTLRNNFFTGNNSIGGEAADAQIQALNWNIAQKWMRDTIRVALKRQRVFNGKFPFFHPRNIAPNMQKRAVVAASSGMSTIRKACRAVFNRPRNDFD